LVVYVGCGGLALNIIGLALFAGRGGHGHSHGGGGGSHGHSHGGAPTTSNKGEDTHSNDSDNQKQENLRVSKKNDHKDHKHDHKDHKDHKHDHKDQKDDHKDHKHDHKHDHKEHKLDHKEHKEHKEKDHKHKLDHKHDHHDDHDHVHDHDHHDHVHSLKKLKDSKDKLPEPDTSVIVSSASSDEQVNVSTSENFDDSPKTHDNDTLEAENSSEDIKDLPKIRDENITAVFLHFLGDFLGSLAAIASGLIIYFTPYDWKYYFDPIISVFIVCLILKSSVALVTRCIAVFMQTVPTFIDVDKLQEELSAVPGVISIHDFHVWTLVGTKTITSVHITCLSTTDFMQIASQMKKIFHKHQVHATTIQPEFVDLNDLKQKREVCQIDCGAETCKKERCCPPKTEEAMDDELIRNLINSSTIRRKAWRASISA